MHCNQADNLIDAYMDGELIGELKDALDRHAASCADCRARIDREHALREALADLPVDDPSADFFDRVLARAKQDQEQVAGPAGTQRRWTPRLGGALAAGFVVLLAAGVLVKMPGHAPEPTLPEIALSLAQPTPVNLVFTSVGDLEDARVSLQLPPGVHLAGYDGRRELTWTTDLKDGSNVLTLPLVADEAPAEELVARLEHGEETKTFRLKVRITPTTQGTVL